MQTKSQDGLIRECTSCASTTLMQHPVVGLKSVQPKVVMVAMICLIHFCGFASTIVREVTNYVYGLKSVQSVVKSLISNQPSVVQSKIVNTEVVMISPSKMVFCINFVNAQMLLITKKVVHVRCTNKLIKPLPFHYSVYAKITIIKDA